MLFSTKESDTGPEGLTHRTTGTEKPAAHHYVMGRKAAVLDSIGELTRGMFMPFVTQGKWSTHELLSAILRHTGPAAVELATYSMTEDPVRMLVNYLNDGSITELLAVCDKRFRTQQPQAMQLAEANFPIALIDIHAKCMTVHNADWDISVLMSSNFTRNKRMECGIIIEDAGNRQFHTKWMTDAFRGAVD